MYGKFASYSGTSLVNEDLKSLQWANAVDETIFNCNKITFVANSAVSIRINDGVAWCPLYLDPTDEKYKISFDTNDIKIKSFYTNAAVVYWVGFLY